MNKWYWILLKVKIVQFLLFILNNGIELSFDFLSLLFMLFIIAIIIIVLSDYLLPGFSSIF